MANSLLLARAVHLLATMLVVGTVFFDGVVLAPALAGRGSAFPQSCKCSRGFLASGLVLAILSGAAWFALVALDIGGASSFGDMAWTLATETQFGIAWMLRLVLAAVIVASVGREPAGASSARRHLMLGASAAFAGTLAWSGHGAATPGTAGSLHTAADALHAIAAAVWLGGLVPLALFLGRAARIQSLDLSALMVVRRFSGLGIAAVVTLIGSGIVNTLFVIDRVELLWTTAYGRALLVKIILFAGMLILATYNRLALTPELARSTDAPARRHAMHRLCVHSAIEIALGVAIILIVAWLGITQPAVTAEHMH